MSPSLFVELQKEASDLGFPLFGVTTAIESPGFAKFCDWLDQGYAGSMAYLSQRRSAYQHPSHVMADAKTLVMLGMPYSPAKSRRRKKGTATTFDGNESSNESRSSNLSNAEKAIFNESSPSTGRVAAYATGTQDYHDLIHQRLKQLASWFIVRFPKANVRGVVDTAPLLEREFAALAGLGWIGKNTLLLNRNAGSYFFLAALLTDVEIDPQPKAVSDHCGTCTACLDACPTQAFPQPYVLDASRCISYLTIEHREAIPIEFRESIGDLVFGCDICQQVCPWNRMANSSLEPSLQPQPEIESLDLLKLLQLDDEGFRQKYRKTPLWRTRRIGLQRNAMIVLGNQKRNDSLPLLIHHLSSDNSVLRQTAAWAIGRIYSPESRIALEARLVIEECSDVRIEILDVLNSTRR